MSCFCGGDSPPPPTQTATGVSTGPSNAPDGGVPTPAPNVAPAAEPVHDAGSPVAGCCPAAIHIETPCKVVGVNGTLQLQAVVDGGSAYSGTFNWSTASANLSLNNSTSSAVTVLATGPSASRDAEIVTVQWSSAGCAALSAQVKLTAVRVRFSESPAETYGYDDMDTADPEDDHVSVKKLDTTVVNVKIEGGLTGFDLEFTTDDDDTARVDLVGATSQFNLSIKGLDQDQHETVLRARTKCPDHSPLTKIYINVYKEKPVKATVAKVWDSTSSGTTLSYPRLDVAAAGRKINAKYKAAVATMELTDFSSSGDAVDIPYDLDKNGKLSYDIDAGGGPEIDAINSRFKVDGMKIVIVKNMVSVYYLSSDAKTGDKEISVRGGKFIEKDHSYPIGTGPNRETITVDSLGWGVWNRTVTLKSPLTHDHKSGEPLEWPAAGWSGNPIFIAEGVASEDTTGWTFGHELGHSVLGLLDLSAPSDIMNFENSWTDHRLRYKPLPRHYSRHFLIDYSPGEENQWETISR